MAAFQIEQPLLVDLRPALDCTAAEHVADARRDHVVMGATNPKDAAPGTIRADFATSIDANAVHGSDAPETAKVEIAYFFADTEVCGR